MKARYNMKKKFYEAPRTQHVEVELEGNFCASVYGGGSQHDSGVTIDEHGFANPGTDGNPNLWEGDYSGSTWDE